MARAAELLDKLLKPELLAPLAVAVALVLLSGLFNLLYTLLHEPGQFLAASSTVGPVRSENLQNLTELMLVFTGYAMIVWGLYTLHGGAGGSRAPSKYSVIIGTTLVVVGVLLVLALYYAKEY